MLNTHYDSIVSVTGEVCRHLPRLKFEESRGGEFSETQGTALDPPLVRCFLTRGTHGTAASARKRTPGKPTLKVRRRAVESREPRHCGALSAARALPPGHEAFYRRVVTEESASTYFRVSATLSALAFLFFRMVERF